MANIFNIQGFGSLSEWNGQVSSGAAVQAYQTIASLGSNSVELTDRIWTQTGTSNIVISDPAKSESDISLLAGFQGGRIRRIVGGFQSCDFAVGWNADIEHGADRCPGVFFILHGRDRASRHRRARGRRHDFRDRK